MPQFNRRELDLKAREYGYNRDMFERCIGLNLYWNISISRSI